MLKKKSLKIQPRCRQETWNNEYSKIYEHLHLISRNKSVFHTTCLTRSSHWRQSAYPDSASFPKNLLSLTICDQILSLRTHCFHGVHWYALKNLVFLDPYSNELCWCQFPGSSREMQDSTNCRVRFNNWEEDLWWLQEQQEGRNHTLLLCSKDYSTEICFYHQLLFRLVLILDTI